MKIKEIEKEVEKAIELFKNTKYGQRIVISPTVELIIQWETIKLYNGEINAEEFVKNVCKNWDEHDRLERFNQVHYHDSEEEYEKAYKKEFGD